MSFNKNEYPFNRRDFLKLTGLGGIAIGILGVQSCEKNMVEPLTQGGEIDFITPNSKFFYKNGADVSISNWVLPSFTLDSWKLKIDGLVQKPLEISYSDLMSEQAKAITLIKTMRCVIDSNDTQGLIGNAVWKGIPLKVFLDKAVPDSQKIKRFRLYGADRFTNNMKYDRVYGADNKLLIEPLLVYEMNGEALSPEHGFPVRLILQEGYGFKNVKWLNRVEATAEDTDFGTYQDAGFADDGVTKTNSRMTYPIQNAQVAAGAITLSGFAVSGFDGIQTVEISVDGAAYKPATIMTESMVQQAVQNFTNVIQTSDTNFTFPYRNVWVKWSANIELSKGTHNIKIRATDLKGNTQPTSDTDNSDGINTISSITIEAI